MQAKIAVRVEKGKVDLGAVHLGGTLYFCSGNLVVDRGHGHMVVLESREFCASAQEVLLGIEQGEHPDDAVRRISHA